MIYFHSWMFIISVFYTTEKATHIKREIKLFDTGFNVSFLDDGTSPEKIAHIRGPPERCEHAAQIIGDLLQSIRVREEGHGVGITHKCTHSHYVRE